MILTALDHDKTFKAFFFQAKGIMGTNKNHFSMDIKHQMLNCKWWLHIMHTRGQQKTPFMSKTATKLNGPTLKGITSSPAILLLPRNCFFSDYKL